MPKTIIELVEAKSCRLGRLKVKPNDPPLGEEERVALFNEAEALAKLAVRAITEGRFSLAWREYMLQFVDQADPISTKQLARLMAEDSTITDADMNRRRAYLLGNAVCGGPSPTGNGALAFQVETIDAEL
jgi:hypothetical protein